MYGHQKQVDVYKATMETPAPIENREVNTYQFKNIVNRRASVFNRTPASIEETTPNKSAETNGNLNKAIGPAKMIQVSTGDRVQLEVFARYSTGTGSNNALISNLASANEANVSSATSVYSVDNLGNLVALPTKIHQNIVNPLWTSFSKMYPNPSQAQVVKFAKIIDEIIKPYANNTNSIK